MSAIILFGILLLDWMTNPCCAQGVQNDLRLVSTNQGLFVSAGYSRPTR